MQIKVLEKKITYDGTQLNPNFSYEQGMFYDNIIAFSGPAKVKEHLIDLKDKLNNDFISSKEMLHFIITLQGNDIEKAVLLQRVFINVIARRLSTNLDLPIQIKGNDLFIREGKLSVSIATVSSSKILIHIGLNWEAGKKAPVKTFSLGVNKLIYPIDILRMVCTDIQTTFIDILQDCFKVKTF